MKNPSSTNSESKQCVQGVGGLDAGVVEGDVEASLGPIPQPAFGSGGLGAPATVGHKRCRVADARQPSFARGVRAAGVLERVGDGAAKTVLRGSDDVVLFTRHDVNSGSF